MIYLAYIMQVLPGFAMVGNTACTVQRNVQFKGLRFVRGYLYIEIQKNSSL